MRGKVIFKVVLVLSLLILLCVFSVQNNIEPKTMQVGAENEIRGCSNVIFNITGQRETLFRPTGGKNDAKLRQGSGKSMILWSIDTLDWLNQNSKKIVENVLDKVKDGSVILMHDLFTATGTACETLIPELIKRNYQLVTISELMEINGIELHEGTVYYDAP